MPNTDQPAQQETGRGASVRSPRHWAKRPRTWVIAGAVVVVGGYATAALAVGGEAPRGTSVLGVDVGGMDRGQVERVVSATAADRQPVDLQVTGAGASTTGEIVPADAGLSVDAAGTAARATAR